MQVLISALSVIFLLCASPSFAAKTEFLKEQSNGAKSRVIASFYEEKVADDLSVKKLIISQRIWKRDSRGCE